MPLLPNPSGLPGIAGLMAYRQATGDALRVLAQTLLRGESSLTAGERELIAAYVSSRNGCRFCARSHAAVARRLADAPIVDAVIAGKLDGASPKMKALLAIAEHVRVNVAPVPQALVDEALHAGADDVALHDVVLVAAAFSMFNRYVDALGADTPSDEQAYERTAERLVNEGYARHPTVGRS
jgi:uncharacterized peroxidase-related enzyme